MKKKAVNFRLSSGNIDYVKSQLGGSGMNMTEYLEMLIETDSNSKSAASGMDWDKGVVITNDRLIVIDRTYLGAFWEFVDAGVGIITAIPDGFISVKDIVTMVVNDENVGAGDIVSNEDGITTIYVDGHYICERIKHATGKVSLPRAWV